MTRMLVVGAVLALAGCDKRKKEPEALPPAKERTCQTQAECVLRSKDACNPCSDCAAFHASEPAATCEGQVQPAACAIAPCSLVTAECMKGACVTRPNEQGSSLP